MDDLKIETINGEPSPEDKKVMTAGMLVYHASKGYPRKTDSYSVVIKNKEAELKAVVMVSFLWNGMHIDSLWVDESVRGQNLGTKLMNMVEEEGINRGSTVSYTDTFTYQAPEFYEKLGYKLYGKLENFPENCSLNYYCKSLK